MSTPSAAVLEVLPMLEHFRCGPYATVLRRGACGTRHLRVQDPRELDPALRVSSGKCVACPIGAAHARGERSADAPTVEPTRPSSAPPAAWPVEKPSIGLLSADSFARKSRQQKQKNEEKKMAHGRTAKTYTHDGFTGSLSEWAARLGVTDSCLRLRINKGLPNAQVFAAIGAPAGKPISSTEASKPKPRKPAQKTAAANGGGHSVPREPAISSSAAAEVLRTLGFEVDELQVPAGVALFVRGAA